MLRTILLATILAATVHMGQADHKLALDAMVAPPEPLTIVDPVPIVEAPKINKKHKKHDDFPSSSPSGSTFPSATPSFVPSSVPSATPSSIPSDAPSKGSARSKKGGKPKNGIVVPESPVRRTRGLRS